MAAPERSSSGPSSLFPESSCLSVFKMTKGSIMLKAKRNGTPQFKRFVLSRDLSCLQWGSPRKAGDKNVLISNMTELIKGQKTKVFQHFPVPQSELISFSVVYKIGRGLHTVDVVCLNKQQFDIWTVGLQALINGFCNKIAIDKLYENGYDDETDHPPLSKTEEIPLDALGPGGKHYNEDACDLYTWGDGSTGMLGHGENYEENVPRMVEALLSRDIHMVACGVTHTMVVTKEGEVFSWGSGSCGKLGQGHLRDRSTPLRVAELKDKKVVKVACHKFHSSAVCVSGELYTWGKVGPQLGFEGSSRKEVLPKLVPGLLDHKVIHVACGLSHTLACTKTGKCFAFGDNTFGQLGVEGIALSYDPICVEELQDYHISFATCGNNHSAALSDSGYLWLWGANDSGQLGTSNLPSLTKPFPLPTSAELRNPIITDVSCGAKHTVFLGKKGRLFGMGDNTENQLGINQRGRLDEQLQRVSNPVRIHLPSHSKHAKLVQVSCGAFHTAAVTEAGEIFAWGKGKGGGLGHGDGKDRSLPCELDMDGKRVRSVTCGATHTACLVTRAWISEDLIKNCMACKAKFTLVNRKHHCRKCGGVYCASCTLKRAPILTLPGYRIPRRVCDKCYAVILEDT